METTPLIDLESIAKHLKLPMPGVQRTAELLEEGNTVPFITRFRKDQTGGLDEQKIRTIESELARAKLLAERKETILKSIESRGKLTDKLAAQIKKARILGDLEDIYLPYKPKKQSLASIARARGLEPLAAAVLEAKEATPTLDERAAEFVNEAKDVPNVEAVLEGLKHLIAEHFGHHRQLRARLRRHLSKNGKLVSKKIDQPADGDALSDDEESTSEESQSKAKSEPKVEAIHETETVPAVVTPEAVTPEAVTPEAVTPEAVTPEATTPEATTPEATTPEATPTEATPSEATPTEATPTEATPPEATPPEAATPEAATPEAAPPEAAPTEAAEPPPLGETPVSTTDAVTETETQAASAEVKRDSQVGAVAAEVADSEPKQASGPENATVGTAAAETAVASIEAQPAKEDAEPAKDKAAPKSAGKKEDTPSRRDQRREMRRRRRERLVQSFKDYFDFSDPIGRLPHHRILAINRGERTKVLRVKIECPDWDKVQADTELTAIPADHPYADFLRLCLQDAMHRLLQPSIEREVRRDLNDRAEEHAVTVFARNLRKLLLQPPLREHRVVAIDPGFRSGCKLVALDEFGQILGHTFINLLGKDQQKQEGQEALAGFVQEHKATVVAVGNGAACRETETLVAEVLGNQLKDHQVGYLIVNEAGTSVYSTSELGREELPNVDATVRSAVSIGRRSLDPLSELVKIDPASIGVGLYQHDVKAKHLRESLDAVVESCVNYVGVDVNSASPALLGYVSGLNSLTARKIYEYRQANGPFKNREQLREVSGIGESTYVQAAGFLKIVNGENPLDGTWIHPESYEAATKVLQAIGFSVNDLRAGSRNTEAPVVAVPPEPQPETAAADVETADVATVDDVAADDVVAAKQGTEATSEVVAEPDIVQETSSGGGSTAEVATVESATVESVDPAASETGDSPAPTASDETAAGDSAASETVAPPAKNETVSPAKELIEKLAAVDVEELAPKLGVGKLSLEDILKSLARPGRDPREDLPPPIFRTGILKLEDLKSEMELSGTVLNVVDFGAFVDIGLVDSGLIHVSRLADRYISDPHDVVSVGDILRVWVVDVDQKRRRVSLTAIEPGTERPKPAKESRRRKPRGEPSSGEKSEKSGQRRSSGKPSGRPGGQQSAKGKKFTRGKGHKPNQHRPKAPPKPVVPITKEMEEGSEPMRTFGDLKQLFEKKKRPDSKK